MTERSLFNAIRYFFQISQPTHFMSKITFFLNKVFPELKSVCRLKLTVEYLKLLT